MCSVDPIWVLEEKRFSLFRECKMLWRYNALFIQFTNNRTRTLEALSDFDSLMKEEGSSFPFSNK